MSAIYDNWERLAAAVLKREEIRQLCHQPSRSPSICSESSDFSASFRSSDVQLHERVAAVQKPVPKIVFLGGASPGFLRSDILKKSFHKLGDGTFGTTLLSELSQDVQVSEQELLASESKVVIKLLKEVTVTEGFKLQMEVFGNCRHENVAAPRAYYFSSKAYGKLILYDHHSEGSVSDMLYKKNWHADWETRLRIAIGAARGIVPSPWGRGTGLFQSPFRSISQELDVYRFGYLLLELLTGKSSMKVHGFDKDMDLGIWVRSIKSQDWTSKLFDQSLRRPIRNEKDVIEMVKTEIPGVDLVVKDSVRDWEALRAILRSHFRSMSRVPAGYFSAQDLAEMIETMHVAMRCLEDSPKMSDVVLMLENIKASVSNGKPEHDQKEPHPSEKKWVWTRIF
ncbi:putative inactive receptor-like protein kinase [Sesamum alatum]|uniref:Inactive receptor-like protein kinase n=1 Tax=Sesamum alatum TaxID=300844 RepID=A0AAE1YJC8_9LAMI|nr:putative inactive receptor-like protein kinase [Sesamum alatum]